MYNNLLFVNLLKIQKVSENVNIIFNNNKYDFSEIKRIFSMINYR